MYGAHRSAEHEAGNHCAEVFVGAPVQVQAEPPAIAGEARHCTSLVQDLHFCERMLLARARRLQVLCRTEIKYRILAEEN